MIGWAACQLALRLTLAGHGSSLDVGHGKTGLPNAWRTRAANFSVSMPHGGVEHTPWGLAESHYDGNRFQFRLTNSARIFTFERNFRSERADALN